MRYAQGQGRIRAHPYRDEPISPARGPGAPDIDHHQLSPFASGHINERNLMHVSAIQIGPPGDNVVGVLDALRLRAPRWSDRQFPGFATARVAHSASVDPRRTQGVKQRLREIAVHQTLMRAIRIASNGFTAVAGHDRLPTTNDLVQGLVPRERDKLALALGTNASQWGEQALRRMHTLGVTVHLAAEESAREWVLRIAHRVNHPPCFDRHEHSTRIWAVVGAQRA